VLWAVVDADGTLLRSRGVTSVRPGNRYPYADYIVVFAQDISECSYSATIEGPSGGFIEMTTVPAEPQSLEIVTANKINALDPLRFHVQAFCDP
jgi:hypothetical protein